MVAVDLPRTPAEFRIYHRLVGQHKKALMDNVSPPLRKHE